MSEPFNKLAAQLSKLFELEKADLDFGIHRIIKARQRHIRIFLGLDEPPTDDPGAPTLKKIVQREMGELNTVELERQLGATAEKIKTYYGQLAFENGKLTDGPAKKSGDGQLWLSLKERLDTGEEKANAQLEAEIYSHLTEFFSRYYDEADFLSKRRIKAGNAPYAVPYSGEEVMLHWANKDQYYIKSSKDLKDYTFTLPGQFGGKRVQFKCERQDPVLNNNNAKREFHLDVDDDGNPQIEASEDGEALVLGFHFRIVDKARTKPETKAWIEHLLGLLSSDEWRVALGYVPDGLKTNLLTRHLNNYTRKNETDFFIHKHLGKFLRGELDFFIKNEVIYLDDIDEKSTDYLTTRVRLIKALRTISQHIIRFLAQLENFQKKLWLKKKYVTETQYCITLDRVLSLGEQGEALLDTLLSHVDDKILRYDGEMRSQHDEWIKLYAIDELEDYPNDGKLTAEFLGVHDKLMLDTVFYSQGFKWQLLGAMDDLEERLGGLLIHSENFQALNLLQDRYREKVKCVYIDPPYNTDATPINYKNGFKDSSWLALCNNSIGNARQLMTSEAIICITIDDVEVTNLRQQIETNSPFDELGTVAIKNNPAGRTGTVGFSICHEYAIFCGSIQHSKIKRLPHSEEQIRRYKEVDEVGRFEWTNFRKHGGQNTYRTKRPRQFYPIYALDEKIRIPEMNWDNEKREYEILDSPTKDEETLWPVDNEGRERIWDFVVDTARKEIPDLRVRKDVKGNTAIYRKWRLNNEGLLPSTIWDKSLYSAAEYGTNFLTKMFGETHSFSFPKSIHAVSDCLIVVGAKACRCSITLDYFAGSGTTAHAVIELNREDDGNRNYILVEMGDHFDTVLKPRIQKVAYSAGWKGGKPTAPDTGVSHGFKYLRLESYEDALNNLDLGEDRAPDLLGLDDQVREDFLFSYLLDVETRSHLLNLDRFRDPWGCQLKIHDPHTGRGEARVVDLVETFHYLLGVTVREIRVQGTRDKPDAFLTIEGENPDGEAILIIWRRLEANPLVEGDNHIDWPVTDNEDLKAFAATNRGTARGLNPADTEFHAIYINGDHTLADPNSKIHCTEEVFYERMFANTGNPED
jgi:adenine-specific DNA-methyltransferase